MQNYEYEHNSFILYKDSRIFINRLNKCQRGELLLAIFDYVCDGIIPDFENDAMLQMCFDIIRSYLDRDEKKYQDKCKKNKENIEKRWMKNRNQSNTKGYDRNKSNTNYTDKDTDKDTDTVSDTDTDSDTDTETDTEQADAVSASVDRPASSAAAETAEPPSGDLFSVKQLISTAKRNKVELTSEGIMVFHEEMQENGWMLYGKPVEKKGIVKALRGWAKYHPEFVPEKEPEQEPEQRVEIKSDQMEKESEEEEICETAYIESALRNILHTIYEQLSRDEFNKFIGHDDPFKYVPEYCPKCFFTNKQLEFLCNYAEEQGYLGFEKFKI